MDYSFEIHMKPIIRPCFVSTAIEQYVNAETHVQYRTLYCRIEHPKIDINNFGKLSIIMIIDFFYSQSGHFFTGLNF